MNHAEMCAVVIAQFVFFFRSRIFHLEIDIRFKFCDWCVSVVTGATDGIGKAYAQQLAEKGKNIVLISRTKSKLEEVAKEIGEFSFITFISRWIQRVIFPFEFSETKYNVETKIVAIDFTKGPEIYEKVEKAIEGLSVGILVNNVGLSYKHGEYFLDVHSNEFVQNIINCNILSVTSMCKVVMPKMVLDQKGIIINVSSMAAKIPNPLLAIYAGTKVRWHISAHTEFFIQNFFVSFQAFVNKFSEDLQIEYASQGIIVQSVLPGFVATKMTGFKRETIMVPNADHYVASCLKTIGNAQTTNGYLPHALMQLFITTMHTYATTFTNDMVFKNLKVLRAKAMKREAKEN